MAHQVLALLYRPQQFSEMIGQTHVIRALENALNQQRLHHAYLFTGTRGVGKTSIARILAKCLNCREGVSSTPCEQCQSCQSIANGQAVDVIEIDAASRTKVEDTRDLLDNIQYAPTQSRYKIYIIDEVHMLSKHSFNALLKTLEEPPAHVKFILATTDPQKLPATVLSRCLHFHMKTLAPNMLSQHLKNILVSKQITYETNALSLIATAAKGSVRDSLSLLDQAIAYTDGNLTEQALQELLGTVAFDHVAALLTALTERAGERLLEVITQLAELGVDFSAVLAELIHSLHQIAVLQLVPNAYTDATNLNVLQNFSQHVSPELIQLYYQMALHGQRDLPLAPSAQLGFEMTLLRMLAFQPSAEVPSYNTSIPSSHEISATSSRSSTVESSPASATSSSNNSSSVSPQKSTARSNTKLDWNHLIKQLNLTGATLLLAKQCALTAVKENIFEFCLTSTQSALLNSNNETRLTEALSTHLGYPVTIKINLSTSEVASPAQHQQQQHDAAQSKAAAQLANDPTLNNLLKEFDARVIPDSVQAIKEKSSS